MGNSTSAIPEQGKGHPKLYYEGVTAVREGRYTVSELLFHQSVKEHPGRQFWNEMMIATFHPGSLDAKKVMGGSTTSAAALAGQAGADDSRSVASTQKPGVSGDGDERADGTSAEGERRFVQRELSLPLDTRLNDIIDFLRLLVDIAFAYLHRYKVPKARNIAMMYSKVITAHAQLFLHLLSLYEEETNFYSPEKFDVAANHVNEKLRGHLADERQMRLNVALAEHQVRRWWIDFTLNYTMVAFLYANELPPGDNKERTRIYANCMDNCNLVEGLLHGKASQFPKELMSQLVLACLPSDQERLNDRVQTDESSHEPSSHVKSLEKASQQLFTSLTGSGSVGQQTFLYTSREFSPVTPLQLAINNVLPVKLVPDYMVLRGKHAVLYSPAERLAFYYTSWMSDQLMLTVVGNSPHYMRMIDPTYAAKLAAKMAAADAAQAEADARAQDHRNSGSVSAEGTSAAAANANSKAVMLVMKQADAEDDPEMQREFQKHLKQAMTPKVNPDLDLKNERTILMLSGEENVLTSLPILIMKARLQLLLGQRDRAKRSFTAVIKLTVFLYGEGSPETNMFEDLIEEVRSRYAPDMVLDEI